MTRPQFFASLMLAGVIWPVTPSAAQTTSSPRQILVLHYYGNYQPAIQRFDEGLQRAISASSPDAVDFHLEHLDFGRRSGQAERSLRARHLKEMYEKTGIDVVVVVSDGALRFVKTYNLFEGVPIVAYTERAAPTDARTSEPNVLRVWDGPGTAQTIAAALRLHPATRQLFVVSGKPDNDAEFESEVRAQLTAFRSRLTVTYLTDLPVPELLARVRTLPSDALLLYVRLIANPQANRLPVQTASEILQASAVPAYTLADNTVGAGAVGGYVADLARAGSRVGEVAARVATGTRIASLTPQQLQPVPIFDARELKRWRIDKRNLPIGSEVRFDQPGFWEQYGSYVLAALVLCALQTVVIGALTVQRARRRETEAKNTAILRAVPDLMFLLDRNGVYLDYNAPAPEALFFPPEQFLGRNIRDVLPQDVLEQVIPLFERAWDSDQPVAGEYSLEVAGSQRRFESRLVKCDDHRVLCVIRDITDRARTQAALIASEQRYALATAAGRSGVWDWDLRTNEAYVDPSLKAILGFDGFASRNKFETWLSVVHPDDRDAVMENVQAHLRSKSPFFEAEHRIVRPDGSVRWFLVRGSAVWHDETAVRVIGTETDITERKQSAETLRETQSELARVSRFTVLGEFSASIAHEVSQPLTAILANTQTCLRWLNRGSPDLSEVRLALADVVDAGKRADEVIRRNRELFRHHVVQKTMLDINQMIREAVVLAADRLRRGDVTLATTLSPGLPPVLGDRVELQQVLLNLIVNGVDAMENVDRGGRRIEIGSALSADGAVQVSVHDCGIGLDGVDLSRMFTPSYTTKADGIGVGLSISRLIVEAHGGRLWPEQNDDRGATFLFTVPAQSNVAAT